jgi:hypothetical protein
MTVPDGVAGRLLSGIGVPLYGPMEQPLSERQSPPEQLPDAQPREPQLPELQLPVQPLSQQSPLTL